MTQHSKQDETTALQRSIGARPGFPRKPPTSANDNNRDGPWPLIPFPERLDAIPTGHQELFHRLSTQHEEATAEQTVQASFRSSSWRTTLGLGAYVVGASIAMFGWLYLLWLALITSVNGIFG